MNYIKEKGLELNEKPHHLKPDDLLYETFFRVKSEKKSKMKNKQSDIPSEITFEKLFSAIFTKLSPMHQIKTVYSDGIERDAEVKIRNNRFQTVKFLLEWNNDTGMLTCIYNLSAFDLDIKLFKNRIAKELDCSVSIDLDKTAVCSNSEQNFVICVQGNKICQVSKILKSNC
jgi:translation initiation factor 1 (eIF-1/SUI1)